MCVQGCHILRFLKNNTRSHVGDQYVVPMQKVIKIGSVVLHIFLVIWSKTRNMEMCVQCCHILKFLKNNTRSHVLDLYVVFMQKGIKIGPVVSDRIVFDNRIVKFVFL